MYCSAKTNRPVLPDPCKTPKCVDIMQNFLVLGFHAPIDGGSPILNYMLKLECLDVDPDTGVTSAQVIIDLA